MNYNQLAPITRWALGTFCTLMMLKVFGAIDWSYMQITCRLITFDAIIRILLIVLSGLFSALIGVLDGIRRWGSRE